ncbi:uncharacterized protein LOC107273266 isoform X2 [Cephus cinctus]|nr:uncharacterized protein LOC107273266 isoform X2 [Cephus cinctus]
MQVDNDLQEGVHIRVPGELKKDGFGSILLLTNDNRSISIIDDEIMSASDLRKGFRQILKHPITTCEDEKENFKKTKAD